LVGGGGVEWLSEGDLVLGVLALGGSLALGLHSLSRIVAHSKRCTLDKNVETITLEDRRFMFFFRRYVIPFSAIVNVQMDSHPPPEGGQSSYIVYVLTTDRKFNIDSSFSSEDIERRADAISRFIGRELVDKR